MPNRKKAAIAIPTLLLVAGSAAALRAHQAGGARMLQAAGILEARDVQVGSLVGGRVAAVHVEEGATVERGEALVTFEPDLLDHSIAEQRARVEEMRARLALVRKGPRAEELARARAEWKNADVQKRRLESLCASGAVSEERCDAARTLAETTRQVLAERENGSRTEDIAAAAASLAREEGRLGYLMRQRRETVVTAPADGVLQSIDLRPGDLIAANQPVATLLEPSQLWVRVYVPETRLGLIAIGQTAQVTIDTYHDRTFPARVVEIGSRAEYTPRNVQTLDQRSDTVFPVKLAVEPSPALKPGMAALATFGGAK